MCISILHEPGDDSFGYEKAGSNSDVNLHVCITPSQPDVTLILPKSITYVKTP